MTNDDDDEDDRRDRALRDRTENDRARTREARQIDDPIQRALANHGLDARRILATPRPPIENAATREASEPQRVPRARLEELGWPRRALDEAEHANPTREAIMALRAHGDRQGIVVLAGEKGSGKTVAAAWWAMQRPRGTAFVRSAEFARTSRYDAARQKWTGAHALCIDDLGAEYADAKESFITDLDELIDIFYSDRRRLIITTNSDSVGFRGRYGERIVDRLAECGTWVKIRDTSMRREVKPPWE